MLCIEHAPFCHCTYYRMLCFCKENCLFISRALVSRIPTRAKLALRNRREEKIAISHWYDNIDGIIIIMFINPSVKITITLHVPSRYFNSPCIQRIRLISFMSLCLNSSPLDKMATISQTKFSHAFVHEWKVLYFHSSLLLRVQLTVSQHWCR